MNGFSTHQSQTALNAVAKMSRSSECPIEQEYCVGVSDQNKAKELSNVNRPEFDKHFNHGHDCYRSKNCELKVPLMKSVAEEQNWKKKRGNKWQCHVCSKGSNRLSKMNLEEKDPSLITKETLIGQLNMICRNCAESTKVKDDQYQNLRKDKCAMTYAGLLLNHHGMENVFLNDDTLIRKCSGKGNNGLHCCELLISSKRAHNSSLCKKCDKRKWNTNKGEQRRQQNHQNRTHPSNKTPHCHITSTQRAQKSRKTRDFKRNIKRKVDSLKKKLEKKQNFIDKELAKNGCNLSSRGKRRHENFKRQTEDCMKIIMGNKQPFEEILKNMLMELFKEGFAREKRAKTNGYEYDEEDVEPIVEQIFEQMRNEMKVRCGKNPSFSAQTYQITHTLFSRSPAHYKEFMELSAFHHPSVCSHEKIKSANRISAGRDSRVYENYLSAKQAKGEDQVFGFLMYDEMKIHEGVVWNSQTGLSVGLAEDMLDLKSLLHRLLSEGGDTVDRAKYVNQWMYIKVNAGRYDKVLVGFWFNDGSLTGDTILNQFVNVVLSLETIKCRVLGVVSDAGGSNASFVVRLRNGKRLKRGWLDEEDCYIVNPFDKSRRIYFWFCVTHLMKSMQGQIKSSQQNGARKLLDKNDTPLGWQVLMDHLAMKDAAPHKNTVSDGCRLDQKVVYPTSHLAMNVSLAIRASEDNTLAALMARACEHEFVQMSAKALKSSTAKAKKEHPFLCTKTDTARHPSRHHGEFLIEIRYLQERTHLMEEIYLVLGHAAEAVNIAEAVRADSVELPSVPPASSTSVPSMRTGSATATPLTDEQRRRIETNRLRALAIRKTNSSGTSLGQRSSNSNPISNGSQPISSSSTRIQKQQEVNYLKEKVLPYMSGPIAQLVAARPLCAAKFLADVLGGSSLPTSVEYSDVQRNQLTRLSALPVNAYLDHVVIPILLQILPGLVENRPEEPLKRIATQLCACTEPVVSVPPFPPGAEDFTGSMLYSGPLREEDQSPSSGQSDVTGDIEGGSHDKDPLNDSVDVNDESFVGNDSGKTLLSTNFSSAIDDSASESDSDSYGSFDGDEECHQDEQSPATCPTVDSESVQDPLHQFYLQMVSNRRSKSTPPNEIHTRLSSIEYLAVMNALFNTLLMNRKESFTKGNYEAYKKFLQFLLDYFDQWKRELPRRRKSGVHRWDKTYIAPETDKNMRTAICGFTYFAKYLLDELPIHLKGFWFVIMQANNTTALEGKFSQFRARGIVTADMLQSIVSCSSNRGAMAAVANRKSNLRVCNDVGGIDNDFGATFSGATLFKKNGKKLDERVEKWLSSAGENNEAAAAPVSRFGSNAKLHKSEVMEILAEEMMAHNLAHSGFRLALMKNEGFQYWYRLSSYSSSEDEWFKAFATSEDKVMNDICQGVLRTFFSKFEDSVHNTTTSFERGYLDYITSAEFEELCQQKLPGSLRGNRQGAIYIVDTLKSLFEIWWYEAVTKLTKPESQNNSECVGMNEESVIIQTHNMVGGAMPKLKKMFKMNSKAMSVIETMFYWSSQDAMDDIEYVDRYLPQYLQHRDRGSYHLLSKEYIIWAIDLMKSCIDLASDGSMNRHRRKWVKSALEALRKDNVLHSRFKAIVDFFDSSLDDCIIAAMYRRIVDYTMRAYAGFRNDMRNNPEKRLANSLNNVKFRTLIQTKSKVTKPANVKEKKESSNEMMIKLNRRNNKSIGSPPSTEGRTKKAKDKGGGSKDNLLNKLLHLDALVAGEKAGRPKLPLNIKQLQQQEAQKWLVDRKSKWREKRKMSPAVKESADTNPEKRFRISQEKMNALKDALKPLLKEGDKNFAKLKIAQCRAILTWGFNTSTGKITRHGDLMECVSRKLLEGRSNLPFWRCIEDKDEVVKKAAERLNQLARQNKSKRDSKEKKTEASGLVPCEKELYEFDGHSC